MGERRTKSAATQREMSLGEAAYHKLLPRYEALPEGELVTVSTDAQRAATAALAVSARVREKTLLARFRKLPEGEFDQRHVEDLEALAWGAWFAAEEVARFKTTETEAQLPAFLVQDALALEARMQKCCEYHLSDDPEWGPEVRRLSPGTGYRDLAGDLLGYARAYQAKRAQLQHDAKYWREGDAEEAIRCAEQILGLLGGVFSPDAKRASATLARAWTLLLRSYDEVARAGRWLQRHEPRLDELYPSLYAVGRSPATPRSDASKKPADPEPEK